MNVNRSAAIFAWMLLAPALIYVIAIVAYPLVDTILLSFTDTALKKSVNWVGWDNYVRIFKSGFEVIILRTIVWTFFSVSIKMIIGVCGATLLNAAVPGRAIFRVLTMPPWIVPMAIGIFMWGWMYNGQFGMISGLLQRFGLVDGPVAFLAYGSTAFWATIFTDVWIGVPLVTLYMLAAIQSIPKDLYEAAWVDGASRWYRFRRITIPQIMPVIVSMALLSAIWTFNSFEIIWIITEGGPRGATTTLIIDTYKVAISSQRFGEGAARAVVIVVLLATFSLFYLWFLNRVNRHYGAK